MNRVLTAGGIMLRGALFCLLAAVPAAAQLRPVRVDASKPAGTIRSFQGVNCGPAPLLSSLPDVTEQYKDLRIDLVRIHDFFGPGDIDARWKEPLDPISRMVRASGEKSIFPNWDADPTKETSYNFDPTDRIVKAIVNSGAAVYFRIGRSWGADPSPPPDFDKFAEIVKRVVMHYNGGWARSFHYGIRYWEFWNEPDLQKAWAPNFIQPFWTGTPEEFYALYEKTARALKSYDSCLKIGACGKAQPELNDAYLAKFVQYCADRGVPLDFYSWHRYNDSTLNPHDMVRIGRQVRSMLDARGFSKAENILSEWNMNLSMGGARALGQATMENAAFTASALIYMQDSALDRALYYRGDTTVMGLFNYDGSYRKKAFVYKAAGRMLDTPQRLLASGADRVGFAALAGRSADGRTVQVLISNYEIPEQKRGAVRYENNRGYLLTIDNLPWGSAEYAVERYRISESENFARTESSGQGGRLELKSELLPPGVELVVVRPR